MYLLLLSRNLQKVFIKKYNYTVDKCLNIMYIIICSKEHNNMREWLSGGAPPCQGGGRGFDPRLALFFMPQGSGLKAGSLCFLFILSFLHSDMILLTKRR